MTHVQTSCLSSKQFTHFFIFNYYYHKIPLCYSKEHHPHYAQCWPLCSLYCLYYRYPHLCHLQTSFQKCSGLQKSTSNQLFQLFPSNTWYAIHLITIWKAENTVWVTKTLSNIIDQLSFFSLVFLHTKKASTEATIKVKCFLLSAKHCNTCLNFVYTHKNRTIKVDRGYPNPRQLILVLSDQITLCQPFNYYEYRQSLNKCCNACKRRGHLTLTTASALAFLIQWARKLLQCLGVLDWGGCSAWGSGNRA